MHTETHKNSAEKLLKKLKKTCKNYGEVHEQKQSPAYGQMCSICNSKHHFGSVCMSSTTYKETQPDSKAEVI